MGNPLINADPDQAFTLSVGWRQVKVVALVYFVTILFGGEEIHISYLSIELLYKCIMTIVIVRIHSSANMQYNISLATHVILLTILIQFIIKKIQTRVTCKALHFYHELKLI